MTKVLFENSCRYNEIMNSNTASMGFAFIDPRCDNPLEPELEALMNSMSPSGYLQFLCLKNEVDISPLPNNEHQCRRVARKIVRELDGYPGEKYTQ